MIVQKCPPLTCPCCGSTFVFMTDDGVYCDDCAGEKVVFVDVESLTDEEELSIYQTLIEE